MGKKNMGKKNMRRNTGYLVLGLLLLTLLAGCSNSSDQKGTGSFESSTGNTAENVTRAAIFVAGFAGDKAVIDSAINSVKLLEEEFPGQFDFTVIEGSFDMTKYEPGLRELCETEPSYDIIFAGPFDLIEDLQVVAEDYPEQKFVTFDSTVDFSISEFKNVYSFEFYQNQSSFLAGAAAAFAAENKGSGTIGVVAGMDIPALNDFVIPYIEGARHANRNIRVAVSYVGNFEDSAKGKELALTQYNQGAAVIFGPAGQAALGVFEASVEKGFYSVGCDGDQAALFAADGDEEIASYMVTSAEKKVDRAILLTLEQYRQDISQVPWGTGTVLGLKEGCVGIADNRYYREILTQEQITELEAIRNQIIKGEIEVISAFDLSTEEVAQIRQSVSP